MKKNKLLYLLLIFLLFVTCTIRETFPKDTSKVLVIDSDGETIRFCNYRVLLDQNMNVCKAIPEHRQPCKTLDTFPESSSKTNRAEFLKKNLYKGLTHYILESGQQKVNRKILFSIRGMLSKETAIINELETFLTEKEFIHTKSVLSDELEAELTYQSIQQKFGTSQELAVIFAQKESTKILYSEDGSLPTVFSEHTGFEKDYQTITKDPSYKQECFQPPSDIFKIDLEQNIFTDCKQLLDSKIFSSYQLKDVATRLPKLPIYGSGQSFHSVFKEYNKESIGKGFLEKKAKLACSKTMKDLVKNISMEEAKTRCYTLVYLLSLLETTGIEQVYNPLQEDHIRGFVSSKEANPRCN
jgi:hypothetical protein